jgi:tetratricopeptide (TPR) repeat protein
MSRDEPISRDRVVELFVCAALALVTVLVYCRCFDHPFINLDDPAYISENRHVQAGLTADSVRWAFTTFDCANWHPLTWLSLQLDCVLYGGLKAGGFHGTNVLLHTVNTLLLFLVLGRLTGAVGRSAVVAGLFALHPLHVESVAWVAERKDVLSTLFWMLTLAAYLFYVRRPSVRRYLLVVLALALGLMAKPMLVTLPCVLLLLDYWPLGRWRRGPPAAAPASARPPALCWGQLVLEKVPLFALVLASCVLTLLAQSRGRAVMSFESFPLDVRFGNALLAYVAYLGKMLWPLHLAILYPHPGTPAFVGQVLGAGVLLVVLTVLVLGPGRTRPYLAVGWLWYLGTLVPVIGLVQVGVQALADRYTYVPLIGLFLLLTWGVTDLMIALRLPWFVQAGTAALVLSACVALTWTQLGYWSSDFRLWEHAVAVTDRNALAHANLGGLLRQQSQWEEAAAEFRQALAIDPKLAPAHNNLGAVLRNLGQWEEAVAEFRQALALDPKLAGAHAGLAVVLADLGRWEEAAAEFRQALELDPTQAGSYYGFGLVLRDLGRREEAVTAYRQALALDPTLIPAQAALGQALLELGRYQEAEASTRRALALLSEADPLHATVSRQLEQCRYLQALEQKLPAFLAGKVQPASPLERLELAWLCRRPRQRRYAAASRFYAAAFAADPKLADDVSRSHRYNAACAAVLAAAGQGKDAAQLGDPEKARLRGQALDWLEADLAFWTGLARTEQPPARSRVQQALRLWKGDPDLAGVRDPKGLARLPKAERQGWRKLWTAVDVLLNRVGGKE